MSPANSEEGPKFRTTSRYGGLHPCVFLRLLFFTPLASILFLFLALSCNFSYRNLFFFLGPSLSFALIIYAYFGYSMERKVE